MKLNYRDKVILGIVLAIAILLGGYFALIKPKNEDIKTNKSTLEGLEKTEREYKQRIAQIDPLKEEIGTIVDDTNKITKHFVPIEDVNNPVKLDRYMQHFAVENNVRITNLAVGDIGDDSISYYFIDASKDIGSGLREFADINGDYQKVVDNSKAESVALAERESGSVLKTDYGITATGTRDDLFKFMSAIEEQDKTIIIKSVDYQLKQVEDETDDDSEHEPETNADGEELEIPTFSEDEKKIYGDSEIEMSIVISIYSVYDLPQLNVDNIE
jgi:Tfp pilus assembly protein PilO